MKKTQYNVEVKDFQDDKTNTLAYIESWFNKNNLLDRENGPAFFLQNKKGKSFQRWHKDGQLHREDGPAIVAIDNKEYYYLYGVIYTKEDVMDMYNKKHKKDFDGKRVTIDGKEYVLTLKK